MLPYSWNILILVKDHYKDINNKIQILAKQCGLPIIGRMLREEAIYQFEPVYIKIKLCPTSESIHNLRGYKADTIFTEAEWMRDLDASWQLRMICPRLGMVKSIEYLNNILEGHKMYNYKEEMIKDIKQYILNNNWVENNFEEDYYSMLDKLYDELWDKDEITGNGTMYYASEVKCAEYVVCNIPLYLEAIKEFGIPMTDFDHSQEHSAQHMDATIRCYLLRDCLEEACEQM